MFSAVPPEKRDQVNAFLNGVPEQAGVFLAGGILIIGETSFTPQQLYFVGLAAAIATTFIIWRASSAYRGALVSSLQEGRPTIFNRRATMYDSTSLAVALENIKHPDSLVRRASVEMLGEMNHPEELIPVLQDDDSDVRIAALKGLTQHPPAMLEVSAVLSDPEPAARQQAIRTLRVLSPYPRGLHNLLIPILQDKNIHVQIEAALSLLKTGDHESARDLLRHFCVNGTLEERIQALNAMSELGDRAAYALITTQLNDHDPSIRRAAALALASCGEDAIPILVDHLNDENKSALEGVANSLAAIGKASTLTTITALSDESRVDGALLALSNLPVDAHENEVKIFAEGKIKSAVYYNDLARKINPENDRLSLLIDSIHAHAQQEGIRSLLALSLLNDRESIQVSIDNLRSKDATQRANALETLEGVRESRLIRPILPLWENFDASTPNIGYAQYAIEKLLHDTNPWLRACAVFAAQDLKSVKPILDEIAQHDLNPLVREITLQGENMDTRNTLSIMERVLLLRRVSLFTDLTPTDLQRMAALATEHHTDENEVIFEQGDAGEEMYIIVHGEVKVLIDKDDTQMEFARRKTGEVIGEMSLISGEPRIATLVAAGEAHLLCLDRKSFEGILRERPEVSLAIMRVLCARLKEATK
jgi:HEAT repeat protein